MPLAAARIVVWVMELYAMAGTLFAICFLPRAVTRMDPCLAGAPRTVRLLILPGIVALWPVFAWRWLAGASAPTERTPHRVKAGSR